MRTEPIDILLKYPDVGISCLQVFVPEGIDISKHPCANMKEVEYHVIKDTEDAIRQLKEITSCEDIFIHCENWSEEVKLMNGLYDFLELNNGFKNFYICPTKQACKVFASVAKDVELCNPRFASTCVPEDGFGGLMDILDEMYPDEEVATAYDGPMLEVGGNGGVWYKGEPVGMLTGIKKVTYGRENADEHELHLNILEDKKYVKGVRIGLDDVVTPSGYFRENSANIFYDMSEIEPGTIGIVKYQVNKNDKKAYHVMKMWQALTVYTEYGSPVVKATTGTVPSDVEVITTRPPFPLNNALGILFARIGAADARWNADVIAEISYAGESVPITYKRKDNGSVSLYIGEFSLDDDNYFKYGTRQE